MAMWRLSPKGSANYKITRITRYYDLYNNYEGFQSDSKDCRDIQGLQTIEYRREYSWQVFTWITMKQLYKDTWDYNGVWDNWWVQKNNVRRGILLKNLLWSLVPTSESVRWKYDNIRNK